MALGVFAEKPLFWQPPPTNWQQSTPISTTAISYNPGSNLPTHAAAVQNNPSALAACLTNILYATDEQIGNLSPAKKELLKLHIALHLAAIRGFKR